MQTTITLSYSWDMGHRLPLHDGKCRRLHGHRYVAEVDLSGPIQTHGPGTGMIVDFYIVKEILKQTIGMWDHRTMLSDDDPMHTQEEHAFGIFRVPFTPTAENIAEEIFKRVEQELIPDEDGQTVFCTRVRVYETPNGWAEVRRQEEAFWLRTNQGLHLDKETKI